MKVIFMGTPDFAVPALQALIQSKHSVAAVFTQAPKAKNRGMIETRSKIHEIALTHSIPVYTPNTLKSDESLDLINNIDADIIVVVAYGFIIPKKILEAKKYGCLNIHPSALPRFRGAAPLQRAIIAGDNTTEVCIMQMDEGLDTGDIILAEEVDLHPHITLKELHDTCARIGADLLISALDNIDILPHTKQPEEGLVYAHKLTKEEGVINWSDSAFSIDCKIRGMNPWPGVFFEYKGTMIKVLSAEYSDIGHSFAPGTVIDDKLTIACGKGVISIQKLQRSGKSAISAQEFLHGCKIKSGEGLS